MQAVSIHVVDVAHGVAAAGMRVDIWRGDDPLAKAPASERWTPVVSCLVGPNGVVDGLDGATPLFTLGVYEMRLHVADYFRARGTPLPQPTFMEVQVFRFGITDLAQHCHLPVKLTPWGLSCFRGAA